MGVDYTSGWDVLIATSFDNVNSLLDDAYQAGLVPSSGSGSFTVQPLPGVNITVAIASATVAPWTVSGGTGQNVVVNIPFTGGKATIGTDSYPLDGVTLQVTANLEFVQSTLSGGTQYELSLNLSNSSAIVSVQLQVPSSLNLTSEDLTALQESLQLLLEQTLAGSGYQVATIDSSMIPPSYSWLLPTQGMEYVAATDPSLAGGGALAVVLATINPPGPQPALVPGTIPSGCDSALIISNEIFTQQFLAPSFASSLNVPTSQITYGGSDPTTAMLSGTASVSGATITSAQATANNDSISINLAGNASPMSGVTVTFSISATYSISLGGTPSDPVISFTQTSFSDNYSSDIAWWVYLVSGLTLGAIGALVVAAIQSVANSTAGTTLSSALPSGFSTSFVWPFSGSVAITTAELPLPLQLGGSATVTGTFALPDGELVSVENTVPVYLMIFGQACLIPDEQTANNLFGTNFTAQQITQAQFDSLPQGPALTSGACLINPQGSSSDYLYTWGHAHWIASSTVFTNYGFNNGTTYSLPATVVQAIPAGPDLSE